MTAGEPNPLILVTGSVMAEGAFISSLAERDPEKKFYAIRAQKVLADSNWMGTDYKLRYASAGEMASWITQQKIATEQARQQAVAKARALDAAHESAARMLLARYGILFRDLLTRESNAPKWRDLLNVLRRLEARGEVRGGRFVTGFAGEQFALPQAVESLHRTRNQTSEVEIQVAAADPMNLAGIVLPGERTASIPGRHILYRNGCLVSESSAPPTNRTPRVHLPELPQPPSRQVPTSSLGLFQ